MGYPHDWTPQVIFGKSVAWVILLALLGDGSNFRLRRLDIESIWVWINTYKNTIFSGMNIHLPAILMFTRATRFWHTAILLVLYNNILTNDWGTQPLTKPFLRNFSGLQKLLISSRLSSLVALPWLAVLHPTRPRIIPKEGRFPALQLDQLPFLWVYRPPMGAELHSWFFRSGNRTWMLWPHSWWTQVRHCRKRTWLIRKEVSCCFCFFPTTTVTSPTCVLLHLHVCNGSHVVDLPPLGPTFRKNAEQMRKGLDKSRHHGAAI